jgi:hypothetical protein
MRSSPFAGGYEWWGRGREDVRQVGKEAGRNAPGLGRRDPRDTPRGSENVLTLKKSAVALFADRASRRWIVRDPEGNFWLLPPVENCWDHREPFRPTDGAELEPIPGHYKDTLGLPF